MRIILIILACVAMCSCNRIKGCYKCTTTDGEKEKGAVLYEYSSEYLECNRINNGEVEKFEKESSITNVVGDKTDYRVVKCK